MRCFGGLRGFRVCVWIGKVVSDARYMAVSCNE